MRQTGIIYIALQQPSTLTEELSRAGFRVWEAMEESEIKHLCATEDIDGIVLAYDVPWRKEIAARSGRVCVLLEPSTSVKDSDLGVGSVVPDRSGDSIAGGS
jgi:hypothetical protein